MLGIGAKRSTRRRFWSRLTSVFGGSASGPAGRFETSTTVLDHYVAGFPNLQSAIDVVPGWVGAMPPQTGLTAGQSMLFADTRINWLLSSCYNVKGKSVLELGPLEGFHTFMLHQAGAARIDAIDANALAFFRCLITKEALKLHRANFLLGDFMKWLEKSDRQYDLVVASGVLYHSHDPIRLLELICARAQSFYLWTHYFDEVAMPRGDLRRVPFSERVETKTCRGVTVRLHERSYYKAWRDPAFCGGIQDRHFWIDRNDIMALIAAFGFDQIKIADDEPDHINGPSFSIFAERAPAEASKPIPPVQPVTAPAQLVAPPPQPAAPPKPASPPHVAAPPPQPVAPPPQPAAPPKPAAPPHVAAPLPPVAPPPQPSAPPKPAALPHVAAPPPPVAPVTPQPVAPPQPAAPPQPVEAPRPAVAPAASEFATDGSTPAPKTPDVAAKVEKP